MNRQQEIVNNKFSGYGSTLESTFRTISDNHNKDLGRKDGESFAYDTPIRESAIDLLTTPLNDAIVNAKRELGSAQGAEMEGIQTRIDYLTRDEENIRESLNMFAENIRESGFAPSDLQSIIPQTMPLLVLSPMGNNGKYLMPSRNTKRNTVVRKRSIGVYTIDGVEYIAPDCFQDQTFMDKVMGSGNEVLVRIPLTKGIGVLQLDATTQVATVDQGANTITEAAPAADVSFVTEELFPRAEIAYIEADDNGTDRVLTPVYDESNRITQPGLVNLGEFRLHALNTALEELTVSGGINFGTKTISVVAHSDVKSVVVKVQLTNGNAVRSVAAKTKRLQITRTITENFVSQFSYGKDQEFDFNVLEGIDLTMESIERIATLHNQVKDKYTIDYVKALPALAEANNGITSSAGFKKHLSHAELDINAEMANLAPQTRQDFRASILPETFSNVHIDMEGVFTQAKGMRSVWLHGPKFTNRLNGGTTSFTKGIEYAGVTAGTQVYTMVKSGRIMNFVESWRGDDLSTNTPDGSSAVANSKSNISVVGNVINIDEKELVNEFVQGWQFLDKPNPSGGSFYRSAENPFASSVTFFSRFGILDYQHVGMRVNLFNCY